MASHPILTDQKDHVGIITLNRPDTLNTFTVAFAKDLNAALIQMDQNKNIRVIVIRSAGKHFSTGIALDEFKDKGLNEYREMIQIMDLPYHQSLDYLGELFASLCVTKDAHEGLQAFEEKRKPVWKNQ